MVGQEWVFLDIFLWWNCLVLLRFQFKPRDTILSVYSPSDPPFHGFGLLEVPFGQRFISSQGLCLRSTRQHWRNTVHIFTPRAWIKVAVSSRSARRRRSYADGWLARLHNLGEKRTFASLCLPAFITAGPIGWTSVKLGITGRFAWRPKCVSCCWQRRV